MWGYSKEAGAGAQITLRTFESHMETYYFVRIFLKLLKILIDM